MVIIRCEYDCHEKLDEIAECSLDAAFCEPPP